MFGKRGTAGQGQNGTQNSVSMDQSHAPSQESKPPIERDQPTQSVANAQPATNENPVKAEPLRKPVAKERLQEVKVGIFNDLIEAVDLAQAAVHEEVDDLLRLRVLEEEGFRIGLFPEDGRQRQTEGA